MGSLNNYITSDVEIKAGALTADGFGRPMILGTHSYWTDRYRLYSSLAAMADDGFLTTDQIYIEAEGMFAQRPRPSTIMIGRRLSAVAQSYKIVVPASPDNSTAYGVRVNGVLATYTTDGSATQAELQAGILAAINALAGATLFTATTSSNDVVVTSDQAGIGFTLTLEAGPSTPFTLAAQTKVFTIPASPANSELYRLKINGVLCSYITGSGATQAELRDGLITDINLKLGDVLTASASTNDVLVTGDVGGVPFSYEVVSGGSGSTAITLGAGTGIVPNHGVAEDLAEINAVFSDWYGLRTVEYDAATIRHTAQAVEGMVKRYFAQTLDSNVVDAPYDEDALDNPATDIASRLKNLGYTRTTVLYTESSTNPLASALMSRAFAEPAGSITYAFKELAGVTATVFSETQRTNLLAKNATGFETIAGRRITFGAKVAVGEYIDIMHGVDELNALIQQNGFLVQLNAGKNGMTQGGIMKFSAAVESAIKRKVRDKLIAESRELEDGSIQQPAYTVTPPSIFDISVQDRADRTLENNPIVWEGTLEGAIHFVGVRGTLSV